MKRIAVLLALFASISHAGLPDSQLKVELGKSEDSAGITSTHNAAVVTITSKSGIGGAKLIRTGEGWPARLTIRLGVKGLESFGMENGIIHANTSLKRPKGIPYWQVGKDEKRPEGPDGTLEIAMTKTDEVIEIVIPREMMDGNPEWISFGWIDFFRR